MTETIPNRRRSRRPTARARGIAIRWQAGRWVFRARIVVDRHEQVGPWHEDQERAIDDRRKMALRAKAAPRRIVSLGDAIRRVTAQARERGLPAYTVRHHYEVHGRYLLRQFGDDLPVGELSVERVQRFVREALDAGRKPATLVQKDLPILRRACEVADVPSPIAEVKRIMRARLKVCLPPPKFFSADELRELLRRMREETFTDAYGQVLEIPGRADDADLCEFIAGTGVRSGELGRVALHDVDLERGTVLVAVPKDHANPRHLVIGERLRPVVERLVARAEAQASRGENEGRLFVPRATWWIVRLGQRWQRRLGEPRLNGRTLRHTYVSGVVASGGTAAEARDLAGHKHLSTTDRYVHAIGARRAEVSSRWVAAFARPLQ